MAKPVTARQAGRQSSGSDGPEPVRVLTHGGLFLTQNDGPAPSASLTRLNQGHPLLPWNVCWHGPESVTVRLHVRNNATTLCSCHIPACSCTSHAAYLRNEHELRQSASPTLALCLQCFPQCWCPRLLGPTASPPASLTTRPAGDGRPANPCETKVHARGAHAGAGVWSRQNLPSRPLGNPPASQGTSSNPHAGDTQHGSYAEQESNLHPDLDSPWRPYPDQNVKGPSLRSSHPR